jgi:hypothetical protein
VDCVPILNDAVQFGLDTGPEPLVMSHFRTCTLRHWSVFSASTGAVIGGRSYIRGPSLPCMELSFSDTIGAASVEGVLNIVEVESAPARVSLV